MGDKVIQAEPNNALPANQQQGALMLVHCFLMLLSLFHVLPRRNGATSCRSWNTSEVLPCQRWVKNISLAMTNLTFFPDFGWELARACNHKWTALNAPKPHWGLTEIRSLRLHREVLWASCGHVLLAVGTRMFPRLRWRTTFSTDVPQRKPKYALIRLPTDRPLGIKSPRLMLMPRLNWSVREHFPSPLTLSNTP